MITTGYYGIPGRSGGAVHLADEGHPVCGTKIDKRAVYQWCAGGVHTDYVECRRCKPVALKMAWEEWERIDRLVHPRRPR